jgi:hypothetical protein
MALEILKITKLGLKYYALGKCAPANWKEKNKLVPRAGVEPARTFGPRDFKSLASTCFATWAIYL